MEQTDDSNSSAMQCGDDKCFNFSKVELHCHLDGCYRIATVAEIARKRGIELPSYDPEILKDYIAAPSKCSDLDDFLDRMAVAVNVFRGDADAIMRLTTEAIEDKARDRVKYIEMRYSPHLLANCDVQPLLGPSGTLRPKDVVDVVNAALEKASHKYDVTVRTILCNITVFDWEDEVLKLCQEYEGRGVVGVDVAGPEDESFPEKIVKTFQRAAALGIHRTAHAGGVGPASHVKQAIAELKAERVGHGYNVVDDESVLELAQSRNTHFEVCPLSSYLTSVVTVPWNAHPAKTFLRRGINFGLNTDDPGPTLHGIDRNYEIALDGMGFTMNNLLDLNLNAARSCFLDGADKQNLVNELQAEYRHVRS